MPTNTQIVANLTWTDAPPDLSCIPGDLNQLGQVLSQFFAVNSTTNEIDTASQTSIAQQALATANIALAQSAAALAAQPSLRSSGANPIPLSASNGGDSTMPISWSPSMPDTNYIVLGSYYGPAGSITTHRPNFRIVTGSQTVNSCILEFNDTPPGYSFAYLVRSLTT